jgi:phenylalanyl-tRNA synthetase alpha chain
MGCGMVEYFLKTAESIPKNITVLGMGIERIYVTQIGDIRMMFYENDVRFLEQFKASI